MKGGPTLRSQQEMIRQIRAILLGADLRSARWTARGYCLRNKPSVHREGFRIAPDADRAACVVRFEIRLLIPYQSHGTLSKMEVGQRVRPMLRRYERLLAAAGFTCEMRSGPDHPPELVCRRVGQGQRYEEDEQ